MVWISASRQELFNNGLSATGCRENQGSSARGGILMINIDSCMNQRINTIAVFSITSCPQSVITVLINNIQFGILFDQKVDYIAATLLTCQNQRVNAGIVF